MEEQLNFLWTRAQATIQKYIGDEKTTVTSENYHYDGEIVFSKNNVCVHHTSSNSTRVHDPGYMIIYFKEHQVASGSCTLLLTWVSNSQLIDSVSKDTQIEESLQLLALQKSKDKSHQKEHPSNSSSFQDFQAFTEMAEHFDPSKNSGLAESEVQPFSERRLSTVASAVYDEQQPVFLTYTNSTTEKQPENNSKASKSSSIFHVDLRDMKRFRVFYSPASTTQGVLVIVSRENQFKSFYFHTGGLDHLARVLESCKNLFAEAPDQSLRYIQTRCQEFIVSANKFANAVARRPGSAGTPDSSTASLHNVLHPDETATETMTKQRWFTLAAGQNQLAENFHSVRRMVFFHGLPNDLRRFAWPLLLGYYRPEYDREAREQADQRAFELYQKCLKLRNGLNNETKDKFHRVVVHVVDKDVVRTDRGHPFFQGEGNSNVEMLRDILLNVAIARPRIAYTQGMSDMLAPLLIVLGDRYRTFGCFLQLLSRPMFVSPKDKSIDQNLTYLRHLLRLFTPRFFDHLSAIGDAWELLFAHRWLLLCHKREFTEDELPLIWDACFAQYQTDYFHLFVAVAIAHLYAQPVLEAKLQYDETLVYFNELANRMDARQVLRVARRILYEFRQLDPLPCALYGLTVQSRGAPCVRRFKSTSSAVTVTPKTTPPKPSGGVAAPPQPVDGCNSVESTLPSKGQLPVLDVSRDYDDQWDSAALPAVQCIGDHPIGYCPYDELTREIAAAKRASSIAE